MSVVSAFVNSVLAVFSGQYDCGHCIDSLYRCRNVLVVGVFVDGVLMVNGW